MRMLMIATIICLIYNIANATESCIDPNDTYDDYDEVIKNDSINKYPTEFYVLSYSWAPNHCKGKTAEAGTRDYLQCGSGRNFGYILHGLWPQGTFNKPTNYPRACEGDQKKIDRKILNKYLCMTPSVDLLQHEYENHGTCMHDENLEDPDVFFNKAYELHRAINLPTKQITNEHDGQKWFVENNSHLKDSSVYFDKKNKEWRICYDTKFSVISCPAR